MGHALSVLDRYDEALQWLDTAESEAKAEGLFTEQSRIHTLRGNAYFPRGNISLCLAEHQEARRLAERTAAVEAQARALGGLADANYMRGLFRTAGAMFGRCVEICAANGFRRIEAANLSMLGMIAMLELDMGRSIELSQRAVDLAERIGHR